MSMWSRLGTAWRGLRGAKSSTLALFKDIYGGRASKSGQEVSWRTALEVSTVFACARVLANGVAQVPWKLMKADGAMRVPAEGHPLYEPLYRRPNAWQTSFEFRRQVMLHLVLCSNAFVWKNRVAGRIVELFAFEPGRVSVEQLADWSLRYKVRLLDGREIEIPAADIWHLRGPSWSGWFGLEAVKMAREAIGLAMATESSQAEMHKNGVRPTGLYSVEGVLTKEQYDPLRKHLREAATENGGGVMLLDRKAQFTPTSLTGVDAQHLETRKHQVEEICRFFGVMPIMVGQADKAATYASAEQMFLAHVVHTLGPWYVHIEQSADVNLLSAEDRAAGLYTKFFPQALMRGDNKARAEYFAKALGSGGAPAWMTQDEVRELDELNPMGGDAALLPKPTNVAPRPGGDPPNDAP